MGIRRIVTGWDQDGNSIFVRDEEVEAVVPPMLGGEDVWMLGGEDRWPQLPMSGEETMNPGQDFFPPTPGYRYSVFTIPPASYEHEEITDEAAAMAETERMLPGVTKAITDKEGLHATESVDFDFVLEGEVELKIGENESTIMKAGDCCIQSGTWHAWVNKSPDTWAKILVVFIGAPRTDK